MMTRALLIPARLLRHLGTPRPSHRPVREVSKKKLLDLHLAETYVGIQGVRFVHTPQNRWPGNLSRAKR